MKKLILIPGLDGTGLVFEPLLTKLPDNIDARIIRYPDDEPLSFDEHVAFVKKRLPKNEPFTLLAESFSGPVALQLLADPPPNLQGVILVATFARYPRPFLIDLARVLPQKLLRAAFSTTLACRLSCLGGASKGAVATLQKALKQVSLKVLTRRLQILAELPPPPASAFNGPCLYLQAQSDRLVAERAAKQLQQHLPQLEIKPIAGPHIALLADPDLGAKMIAEFMREPESTT
ncbi:MAG: lysophospholipase [Desulfuromonadales bacterium]|nr:lysophospholipase [Desulfuromonadales bacterium]